MDGVGCPQRRAHDNTITAAVRPDARSDAQEHPDRTHDNGNSAPEARRGTPGDRPPPRSAPTDPHWPARPNPPRPAPARTDRPSRHRPHRPAPSTSTRTDRLDPHRPPRPAPSTSTGPTRTDPHRPHRPVPTRTVHLVPHRPPRPENKKRRLRNLKRLRSLVGAEGFEPRPSACKADALNQLS